MSSTAVAPRARKSFSRLKHVLDLPNLIDIQKASFQWFLAVSYTHLTLPTIYSV